MSGLVNKSLGRRFAGERNVRPSEGEGQGRRASTRPPLDPLPLREYYVRCFFCRQTVSRDELDGHHCPGSPW